MTGRGPGGGMDPALRVVVYPPDAEGGRDDLLEFPRRAGWTLATSGLPIPSRSNGTTVGRPSGARTPPPMNFRAGRHHTSGGPRGV